MIKNIKKNGFKTIRFPVTWMHFINDKGKIDPLWMEWVKEVVDWIIESNLYCILNVHNDGLFGNWLNEGMNVINKYIYLWSQIAETFKRYDEHLIFESMKEIEYRNGDFNEYLNIVFNFTQAFVDTIRSSEGYNKDRLLLISGIRMNIDYTCSSTYRMPTDLSNKLAISIIYLYPSSFTITNDDNPTITIFNGQIYETVGVTSWGVDSDYSELVSNFNSMKAAFLDKGIPVILTEVGVFTEQKKEKTSIREYLYTVFSMTNDYDGISACLWDTSNKEYGDTNYFNKEKNEWYDEKIKNIFYQIRKGKNIKALDFYYPTNLKTLTTIGTDGNMYIKIEKKIVSTIILNVEVSTSSISYINFLIFAGSGNGGWEMISIDGKKGKKQYDGSYSFTIDVKDKDITDYVWIFNYSQNFASFKSITI